MLLQVGCEFLYEADATSPAVLMVEPHADTSNRVRRDLWQTEPALARTVYNDVFGNCCHRLILPMGAVRIAYHATVEVSGAPDEIDRAASQAPAEALPADVLIFTLPSCYCLSDTLAPMAWQLFGETEPGWARVQAVCDWIHQHICYGEPGRPLPTTADVLEMRVGVCRDFAHLGVAFCRALTIPARYAFGYLPDIGLPPPYPPMDFHAWFEVYLGGRWWTFDARFNTPRIGRVVIGRGRDAIDVAMVTTFGPTRLQGMTVWSDETDDVAPAALTLGSSSTVETTLGT